MSPQEQWKRATRHARRWQDQMVDLVTAKEYPNKDTLDELKEMLDEFDSIVHEVATPQEPHG